MVELPMATGVLVLVMVDVAVSVAWTVVVASVEVEEGCLTMPQPYGLVQRVLGEDVSAAGGE